MPNNIEFSRYTVTFISAKFELMKLSDDWNTAKAANNKTGMKEAADTAYEVRNKGLEHPIIKTNFKGNFNDQQMEVLKNLQVVDKSAEKEAFKDGVITKNEWTNMRKVAFFEDKNNYSVFIKGYKEPTPIYTGGADKRQLPITDDFNTASFIEKIIEYPFLTDAESFSRAVSTLFRIAGKGDASDNWDHYANGSGETKRIDFERMNKEMVEANEFKMQEINEIKRASELLVNPGEKISISSLFEDIIVPITTSSDHNWYLAVGNYRTFSNSFVSAKYNCDGSISYNADIWYSLRDNYRWYTEAFGILKDLNINGIAKEYKVEGLDHVEDISWNKE